MRAGNEVPQKTFGRFLVDVGVISGADLEDATQAMVLFGGRLGTSLIETGLMDVRTLEVQLGRYHGLPTAPDEWLEAPQADAKAALASELVLEHSAIPLKLERRTLHVAMLDPLDMEATEALAFASGFAIAPHPVAECRYVHLLQAGYGVRPSVRFLNLMRSDEPAMELLVPHDSRGTRVRRQRGDDVQTGGHAGAGPSGPGREGAGREVFGIEPIAADVELLDEATFDQIQAHAAAAAATLEAPPSPGAPAAPAAPEIWELSAEDILGDPPPSAADDTPPSAEPPPAPRPSPADVAGLEAALATADDREDLIDAAVGIASAVSEAVALFVVRGDSATGARAWRRGTWLPFSSGVTIPLGGENLLARTARESTACRIRALHATPLDAQLGRALGADGDEGELMAFPVLLGGRVVNILVAGAGAAPVSALAATALGALAPRIAAAYERLILARKQASR